MAKSRNNGAKTPPTAGALVTTTAAPVPDQLRVFSPIDFKTRHRATQVMTGLLKACSASEAAAAIIPWFCDSLPSPKSRKDYHDDMRAFFLHLAAQGIHPYDALGDHVRLYKEALQQAGRRPATIARALSVLRGTYEQFGKKGLVPWDVVGDIQAVTAPAVQKNTTPTCRSLPPSPRTRRQSRIGT